MVPLAPGRTCLKSQPLPIFWPEFGAQLRVPSSLMSRYQSRSPCVMVIRVLWGDVCEMSRRPGGALAGSVLAVGEVELAGGVEAPLTVGVQARADLVRAG